MQLFAGLPLGRQPWALSLRRLLARHRRLIVAGLSGCAVLLALSVVAPHEDAVPVLVAARDLPAGTRLTGSDLTRQALPRSVVPSGALLSGAPSEGRLLAGAVRRGEPLTDVRLVGRPLLTALPPTSTAIAVPAADPTLVALLQPGDRVEVLAPIPPDDAGSATTTARPQVLVPEAVVLAVPPPATSQGGLLGSPATTTTATSSGTPGLVLAVPQGTAAPTVAAAAAAPLPLVLLPPGEAGDGNAGAGASGPSP